MFKFFSSRFKMLIAVFLLSSCATYYQSNYNFNQEFERGNLDSALENLQARASEANGKKEFLFNAGHFHRFIEFLTVLVLGFVVQPTETSDTYLGENICRCHLVKIVIKNGYNAFDIF